LSWRRRRRESQKNGKEQKVKKEKKSGSPEAMPTLCDERLLDQL